jgi:hypothetical protein
MQRPGRPALGGDAVRAQRDLLRLVGDALQIGGGLDEGEQQAQVASIERSSSLIWTSWRITWSMSSAEPEARQAMASSSWRSTRAPICEMRSCARSSSSSNSLDVCASCMRARLAVQHDRIVSVDS